MNDNPEEEGAVADIHHHGNQEFPEMGVVSSPFLQYFGCLLYHVVLVNTVIAVYCFVDVCQGTQAFKSMAYFVLSFPISISFLIYS